MLQNNKYYGIMRKDSNDAEKKIKKWGQVIYLQK